jgi:hypothetical protein
MPTVGTTKLHVPKAAIEELCVRFEVERLYLFGSAARGTMGQDSDVDLLVEFQPHARIGLIRFHQLQQELEGLFGRKVDLVSKAGLNPLIRDGVLAEALLLHAA